MTAKEFTADEGGRSELASILANPVFQKAWDLALKNLIPDHNNEGLAMPNVGNGYLQQLAGAQAQLRQLERLTMAQAKVERQERRLYTEDDRSLLKQQMGQQ